MAGVAVAAMERQEDPVVLAQSDSLSKFPASLLSLPAAGLRRAFRAAHCALASGNRGYGASFLSGNFAPVPDETAAPAPLVAQRGALPPSLRGAFLRNGPNPYYRDMPGGYHWFDGDGMVHAVRLRGDDPAGPTYASHYVRTRRLADEKSAGWPSHPKLGDFVGAGGLGVLLLDRLYLALGLDGGARRAHGGGTANTALASHAGRILALNEGDLPYALKVACSGLVGTVGRVTFGGAFGAGGSVRAAATPPVNGKEDDKNNDHAKKKNNNNGKDNNDSNGNGNGNAKNSNGTTAPTPSTTAGGAPVTSFTAHPKLDPRTNVLHAFRYTFDAAPYAYYFAIGPDGKALGAPRPLSSLPRASMMHDFAVTKRHAVFFDLPLVFDGGRMVKERQLPFRFAPEHGARVGLLPFERVAAAAAAAGPKGGGEGSEDEDKANGGGGDGVIWYQADEPFMMFHTAACWEEEEEEEGEGEDGEDDAKRAADQDAAPARAAKKGGGLRPPGVVKVVCGSHKTISLDLDKRCDQGKKTNNTANNNNADGAPPSSPSPPPSSSSSSSIPEGERPYMTLLTLDPRTRRCAARRLTDSPGDFPVVSPATVGAKSRFVYFAALSDQPGRTVKFGGLCKLDLLKAEKEPSAAECVVGRAAMPEGVFCGEAVFAPRFEDPALCEGEDDGFLLTFAHDEDKDESWFLVIDARTMGEVAACRVPSRVPYGFHGHWVSEGGFQAARAAGNVL